MLRILFVCHGNICRSPMAEAVLRHRLAKEGLDQRVQVDSAGTSAYHEDAEPHAGTRDLLRHKGISCEGIRSRPVQSGDLDAFDLIIAMDRHNLAELKRMATARNMARIHLLSEFAAKAWPQGDDVPDPWYTGDFGEAYRLIDQGCTGVVRFARERFGRAANGRAVAKKRVTQGST